MFMSIKHIIQYLLYIVIIRSYLSFKTYIIILISSFFFFLYYDHQLNFFFRYEQILLIQKRIHNHFND
jgi:hypothetical protein